MVDAQALPAREMGSRNFRSLKLLLIDRRLYD